CGGTRRWLKGSTKATSCSFVGSSTSTTRRKEGSVVARGCAWCMSSRRGGGCPRWMRSPRFRKPGHVGGEDWSTIMTVQVQESEPMQIVCDQESTDPEAHRKVSLVCYIADR